MQFEHEPSAAESWGKRVGIAAGLFVFTSLAFFVISKARVVCWSARHFVEFAVMVAVFACVITGLWGLFGREQNKIVS